MSDQNIISIQLLKELHDHKCIICIRNKMLSIQKREDDTLRKRSAFGFLFLLSDQ